MRKEIDIEVRHAVDLAIYYLHILMSPRLYKTSLGRSYIIELVSKCISILSSIVE